jgi:hypothetical protein
LKAPIERVLPRLAKVRAAPYSTRTQSRVADGARPASGAVCIAVGGATRLRRLSRALARLRRRFRDVVDPGNSDEFDALQIAVARGLDAAANQGRPWSAPSRKFTHCSHDVCQPK